MAIRVGRWDCPTCGQEKILGPKTNCPACGSPRPENVKFYLTDDAEEVTDEAKIKEAHAGADWVCAHCGGHNKAWHNSCQSCGNAKEVADGDEHLEEKVAYFNQPKAQPIAPASSSKPRGKSKILKIIGGLVFLVAGFMALTLFSAEVDVKVVKHRWSRTIQMEAYKQVTEEDWSLPQGANLIKSWRDVHHYDQVLAGYETRTRDKQVKVGSERYKCGTKDKGNGYFEDVYCTRDIYETRQETYEEPIYNQVPVYATKYQYTIMRWKEIEPLKAAGITKPAEWPKPPNHQQGDNFRQGKRTEEYALVIKDHEGKEQVEKVGYEYWQKVPEKGTLKAEKSAVFGFYKGLKK